MQWMTEGCTIRDKTGSGGVKWSEEHEGKIESGVQKQKKFYDVYGGYNSVNL